MRSSKHAVAARSTGSGASVRQRHPLVSGHFRAALVDRGAAHVAAVGVRRERGGRVHRAAVVPDDEIVLAPVVAIDEAVLRGVGVELLNQRAALVGVHTFYADAMPAD